MKSYKYYVSVAGFNGARKTNLYQSKEYSNKEKASIEFALRQVEGISIDYPYGEYDEIWVYLKRRKGKHNEVLCSTMLYINILKADYKTEGSVI